ncbi:sigma-54-dependent Fis family transcriptional regulator [Photobacterium kishitanii]|uniref:sigma-54 interaction domain-containing protein n=1 Tax=Photobacterium kishitanii TaxID=318456 RepID=UPI000D17067E|nr:sigma 54-interacting transcriptional regulator [Photobacterium kishitanii]PSV07852.1 sigma-54-dependent Fis family transcriptional regulator [Photobacterium kishitanii]PSV15194.1 sigma-54-dependent Fis family transcriptional regulator [Photobacterium kishitanii]PSV76340.1 sigma-54-dependent Fis family transcriptional regulator [Photobacterium kishitanii]
MIKLSNLINSFGPFFELLDVPIAIINTQGVYLYYNDASAQIDQIPKKEALGANILSLYKDMDTESSTMLQAAIYGSEYKSSTQIYYNKYGNKVEYVHSTSPLYDDCGHIIGAIEIGLSKNISQRMTKEVSSLIKTLSQHTQKGKSPTIIYRSKEMEHTVEQAAKIAQQDVPVMIYGATGTGKELFARLIHDNSNRSQKPFIAVNCAAIPENLIESMMFGTEKGAYTGSEKKKGYIEMAEGGTLFLDELNSLSIDMQPKLLRYLQDKSYWRLGGDREHHSNVRVVAAVNESPALLIKEERLREDLFYRLCVGFITIPKLKDRKEDIALLANYFIEKYQTTLNHNITGLAESTKSLLETFHWDGNVRMLENTIIRSLIFQDMPGKLQPASINMIDLALPKKDITTTSEQINSPNNQVPYVEKKISGSLDKNVKDYERKLIINSLNNHQGCLSKAARELGIHRSTLQYKVERHNIQSTNF